MTAKERIRQSFQDKYFEIYDRFIQDELNEQGLSYCFYGHTHISRMGDFFTNVGSYKDGHIQKMNENLIISDVHLGIFPYSKNELANLKELISGPQKIILLGDFFDLFYDKPSSTALRFADFIAIIRKRAKDGSLIYIRGNHDWHIKKYFGINAVDEYREGENLFIHGHEQDPLMNVFPLRGFYSARMRMGHKWPTISRPFYLRYLGK